jgi:hypothetical protein
VINTKVQKKRVLKVSTESIQNNHIHKLAKLKLLGKKSKNKQKKKYKNFTTILANRMQYFQNA